MIEAVENLENVLENTKELIKEMFYSIKNEIYPCFNSAMLLYRPILTHVLSDINGYDNSDLNYSQTINEIYELSEISYELKSRMHNMKNFINNINHKYQIVMDDEIDKVIESWNIIKELVEKIY